MVIRALRHLWAPGWWARRAFRKADLAAIAAAVATSETRHRGEIRVAIEGPLSLASLRRGEDSRARAARLFHALGVDQTGEANGILIYIQLVDRRVEILADRGINALVPADTWTALCREMETSFAGGHYRAGVLAAIGRIGELLATHFPTCQNNPNELPNWPTVL